MWEVVHELAERQHGAVGRRQLVAVGVRASQVHGAVRRGRLVPRARGVYSLPGHRVTPLSEVMVAVLRSGDGARAAGERLLAAMGVRDADPAGRFSVLVPGRRHLTEVTFPWRRDRHPGLGVTAEVDGVPSWSHGRNLLEAAVDIDEDEDLLRLADGIRRRGRRDGVAASRLALSAPQHDGARRVVRLGALDADAAESTPERVLDHLLWDLRPRRQVVLAGHRVDFLLPALRVVVEYDGHADHASQQARRRDRARDDDLRSLGYRVERVTAADLRDPAAVRARILGIAR